MRRLLRRKCSIHLSSVPLCWPLAMLALLVWWKQIMQLKTVILCASLIDKWASVNIWTDHYWHRTTSLECRNQYCVEIDKDLIVSARQNNTNFAAYSFTASKQREVCHGCADLFWKVMIYKRNISNNLGFLILTNDTVIVK